MSIILESIPAGLKLDGIRPINPHPWTRDQTVISPDSQSFATAYDIVEMTMMNEMAGVVWGNYNDGVPHISGYLPAWSICCWSNPFCTWVTPQVFIVKLTDKVQNWPLLAIHTNLGFQIVGEGGLDSRPSDISLQHIPMDGWCKDTPLIYSQSLET